MVLTLPPQSQHITISIYSIRTKKKRSARQSHSSLTCGNDNVYTSISNAVIFTKITSHNNSFCFEISDREKLRNRERCYIAFYTSSIKRSSLNVPRATKYTSLLSGKDKYENAVRQPRCGAGFNGDFPLSSRVQSSPFARRTAITDATIAYTSLASIYILKQTTLTHCRKKFQQRFFGNW